MHKKRATEAAPFHDTAVFRNLLNLGGIGRAMKRNTPNPQAVTIFQKPAYVAAISVAVTAMTRNESRTTPAST